MSKYLPSAKEIAREICRVFDHQNDTYETGKLKVIKSEMRSIGNRSCVRQGLIAAVADEIQKSGYTVNVISSDLYVESAEESLPVSYSQAKAEAEEDEI